MNKLRHLLPYFRPYRGRLALGIVAVLFTSIIGLASPLIIGGAIDSLEHQVSQSTLLKYAALLVGVTLLKGVFQFAQRLLLVILSRQIEFDLRNDFYVHLQRLHSSFFHDHPTGDLMARATNDLNAIRMVCGPAIMYASSTVFLAVGTLFFMFRIHVGLTFLAICTLPIVAAVTKVFGQKIHFLFDGVQGRFSDLSTRVQENLAGARVVRAYVQEENEENTFRSISRDYVDHNRNLIRWNSAFHPLIQTTIGLGFATVLGYGAFLILEGAVTIGQFVTFQLFLGRLIWPMVAIGWVINLTQRGAASMGRVQRIFESEPEIHDLPGVVASGQTMAGALRFNSLDFHYGEDLPPALESIDVDIPAGRTLAVVGRTGSGKSTLLSLVPRLLDPPVGQLTVDGTEIRDVALADLRRSIAMVPQETFLFSATVRDNIAFSQPDASDDEVHRAVTLAGLTDDLERFPKGLDTMVGERGITLSGGQKQRVALARALLRDAPILLLDDCLSAVDAHTEEKILRNLRTYLPGRTVLLATHRIAAARLCDQILVIEDGRVQDQGSHEELKQRDGLYADLYHRQQIEEQLAAV